MASDQFEFGGAIAWRPSRDYLERSRLAVFMRKHGLRDYAHLMQRSTTDLDWFWRAVLDDLGIEFYEPYHTVLDTSAGPAHARWCVGGRMNIVHNCLDKWEGTPTDQRIVLRWEGEEGTTRLLTYAELRRQVNQCANGLRALGVQRGDRVALFMPMCPELIVAFFAVIKIGGVILPLFSGYGADAVATRLADAGASIVITADGFWRRGQMVSMKTTADAAIASSPMVRHVIVVPRLGIDVSMGSRDRRWADVVSRQSESSPTERTDAEEPLMIIYTSGTTGRPKGAVHTHCGFPIKTAQDMVHCFDVQAGETMYWVSDMGWMMGPWEVLGMSLLGGTFVLYDGALDYPGPDRLWSIAARHGVNLLGVSPTLIRSLMRSGDEPVRRHDLSSLRILGSTGEPWNPEPWRWFFDVVGGGRLPIINYSGGTEVSGGLVGGNVLTPLKPAAFAGPPPGIAADVVDDHGRPVRNQVGELIVRAPWIGMTRGFWNDPERYEQTYWSRFPGVWVHGDWAAIDEDGLWYILGRSDDTIKIAGKRLGPAEVESVLVEDPAVIEAAAIGVPDPLKGQSLVCFCVLRPGHDGTSALVDRLKALVADRLGKPLRPETIEFVRELPKTRSAKVMRRVIRAAYLGDPQGDLSSLDNPQAVAEITARHGG
ncbi:MAG TPA: AMP-binding protein [Vicinamibacterales bacterium]|nr:AMP-binding protein [Vicinamibacterales bacterium]